MARKNSFNQMLLGLDLILSGHNGVIGSMIQHDPFNADIGHLKSSFENKDGDTIVLDK